MVIGASVHSLRRRGLPVYIKTEDWGSLVVVVSIPGERSLRNGEVVTMDSGTATGRFRHLGPMRPIGVLVIRIDGGVQGPATVRGAHT